MDTKQKLTCGIIMPISKVEANPEQYSKKHWDHVKKMIVEAITETGDFESIPVWENDSSDQIKNTIFENIVAVDMLVCDISSLNSNVLFELGLRLSIKKPVVIICDDKTTPPFDINDIRYVDPKYPVGLDKYDIPDFQKELCTSIKNTWSRYQKDPNSFSQLSQLKSAQKIVVVDDTGKPVKESEAIAEILRIVETIEKGRKEKEIVGVATYGTAIIQAKEDIESFKSTITRFLNRIEESVQDSDLEEFKDEIEIHFHDLDDFIERIEGENNNG